jgi:predicted negative regulator of RcsB-dependent stress response
MVVLCAISAQTWYNIGLVVVLFVLAVACYWAYQVWQEVHEDEAPASAEELLATFDSARDAGELDEEEYAKVRKRIEETGSAPPANSPRGAGDGGAE